MLALIAMGILPLSWILGNALTCVLDPKKAKHEYSWEDRILAGILIMIGLAEGAHLFIMVRGQSVFAFTKYFSLLLAATAGLSIAILAICIFRNKHQCHFPKLEKNEWILASLFLALVAAQVVLLCVRTTVYLGYDETLETVTTLLKSERLYEVNPLTGKPYAAGMPSRLKILCLPTIYASLSQITKASPELVTWHLIPVLTLLCSYLAYASLAKALFEEKTHRLLFLAVVALLVFVGDAGYGLEGFGLLHAGFQGTTIRSAVLLPWTFGLRIRGKWKLLPLVILAEACIVWTLYGLGMSLLLVLLYLAFLMSWKTLSKRKEAA